MPKIAAIQMCSSHSVDENCKSAAVLIADAAALGADLVVLPENFALMGMTDQDKLAAKELFGAGKIQDFLKEQARQHQLWIVGGTIPLATNDEQKVRAACLVFDGQGHCVTRYDKIHLFDVVLSEQEHYKESDIIEAGNQIVVIDTPVGRLGLAICYDIRFPELMRSLFNLGAEIIVFPSAFTVPTGTAHWEVLIRSRAIENFCYVVGACQGGTHSSGRKTYGHSLIVEPWGQIVAHNPGIAPGVIIAEIDKQKQHDIRKKIPVALHQRIYFDTSKLGPS